MGSVPNDDRPPLAPIPFLREHIDWEKEPLLAQVDNLAETLERAALKRAPYTPLDAFLVGAVNRPALSRVFLFRHGIHECKIQLLVGRLVIRQQERLVALCYEGRVRDEGASVGANPRLHELGRVGAVLAQVRVAVGGAFPRVSPFAARLDEGVAHLGVDSVAAYDDICL